MNQIKSQYETVVNNAQKSYEKIKNIFKQQPSIEDKETDNKLFQHHDNYDIDEDEQQQGGNVNQSKPNQDTSQSTAASEIVFEYKEEEEDIWEFSHRVLFKRSMIDIEHMPYVNFIKRKKIENVLSFIGFGKPSTQFKEVKYIALFEECFIYMIKMSERENNQNNFNKKIGNHYDIRQIYNIQMKDFDKDYKCITVLFILNTDSDEYKSITKEFYFTPNDAKRFMSILKFYLEKWRIPLHFKDNSIYLE